MEGRRLFQNELKKTNLYMQEYGVGDVCLAVMRLTVLGVALALPRSALVVWRVHRCEEFIAVALNKLWDAFNQL